MSSCSGWCNACRATVALVIQKVGPSLIVPAATTAIGGAIGGASGRKKDSAKNAFFGALIGAVVGGVAQAITPAAQKWVCGDCGCDDVRPHAA